MATFSLFSSINKLLDPIKSSVGSFLGSPISSALSGAGSFLTSGTGLANIGSSFEPQPIPGPTVATSGQTSPAGTALITPTGTITSSGQPFNTQLPSGGQAIGPQPAPQPTQLFPGATSLSPKVSVQGATTQQPQQQQQSITAPRALTASDLAAVQQLQQENARRNAELVRQREEERRALEARIQEATRLGVSLSSLGSSTVGSPSSGSFTFGGGGASLPGSLSSAFRSAGLTFGLTPLQLEEERKKATYSDQFLTAPTGPTPLAPFDFSQGAQVPSQAQQSTGKFTVGPVQAPAGGLTSNLPAGQIAPPSSTSTGFEFTAGRPGVGISPGEGSLPPGVITDPAVGIRTFQRVGNEVYETTGGQLRYISSNEFNNTLKGRLNLNQVPQLNPAMLTESQKTLVNRISKDQTGTEAISKPSISDVGEPSDITGADFQTGGGKIDISGATQQEYEKYINEQITSNLDTVNAAFVTPAQETNFNNTVYKTWNKDAIDQTTGKKGAWDVFKLDGTPVTLDEFKASGLNVDHINTYESLVSTGAGDVDPSIIAKILGFDPDKNVSTNDPDTVSLAEKLQAQLDTILAQNPFATSTIAQARDQLQSELGLNSLYDESLANKGRINEILNRFDTQKADIEDDPDFSKNLKGRRTTFLESKTQTTLDSLIRNQDLIDQKITRAEKEVTTRLGDMVTQYNIWRGIVSDAQGAIDRLADKEDKKSENARRSIEFVISHPDALKGASNAQLNQEFAFIEKNGYIPQSMISRTAVNAGKSASSWITNPNTGDVFAVNEDGVRKIGNVGSTRAPSDSDSSPYSNIQYKDNGDGTFTSIGTNKLTGQPVVLGNIQAGAQSKDFLANQYSQWLLQNKGVFEKDDLQAVLGAVPGLSTLTINENKPLFDLIDSFDKGGVSGFFSGKDPQAAITSFNNFIAQKPYIVVGPDGATGTVNITNTEASKLQAQGYTVTPQ